MVSSIFYIEYLLVGIVLVIALRSYFIWSKEQEEKYHDQMDLAEKEYNEALENYALHPDSSLAEEHCFSKGEYFYQFKLPDYFNYPLGDTIPHIEFMNNFEQRKKMIQRDVDVAKRCSKKNLQKVA